MSTTFADRPTKTLCLFDVDDTLTLPRRAASPAILELLRELRKKAVIGFVSGSDLGKLTEQLGVDAIHDFDYAFGENGLTAFKMGKQLPSQSFINYLGEDKYKVLIKFILHYLADMDIPIRRGTFVEFRNGMINVCPMGRNARHGVVRQSLYCTSHHRMSNSMQERKEFEAYDKQRQVRAAFVRILQDKFASYDLTFAIGGKISFDVFPRGWDKTYALRHVQDEGFEEIHFFGDQTHKGGNDYEIFEDPRTIGHTVSSPEDTARILKELFF